jgi:FdhD protein
MAAVSRRTVRQRVLKVNGEHRVAAEDVLAGEEPLEIRVNGRPLSVTMRTPGEDVELAHGFLLAEGVIASAEDVIGARYCAGLDEDGRQTYNVLDVRLAPGVAAPAPATRRDFITTSSCGVCGAAALDAVRRVSRLRPADDGCVVAGAVLSELPDRLRTAQHGFTATGGLHAAGLFDTEGSVLAVREDVGRHNAVDKLLGWALCSGEIPARARVLMLSGRVSFELVQKAAMAGIPVVAAVSAPSSLAVALATDQGITVVGFLRADRMNVYTETRRVTW